MSEPAPTSPPILSVSEITQSIKHHLETHFFDVMIQGEISNFKRQSSGHLYFSLKDSEAQMSCVMFRGFAARLSIPLKDGDKVVVTGEITVYPPKGGYQLVIKTLRLAGLGELLLRLEELKREIQRRGWFSAAHKKPLPLFPKIIGVITSPTGAVIQDILHILKRRHAGFHLILYPVKVQGEGAAQEISLAIDEMNRLDLVDVIIVGRGGGSIEDLWAFNEECVAASIFHSTIPIISAVGHETDHCIADYVADVRAPTPSAAAEIVTGEKQALIDHLTAVGTQMTRSLQQMFETNRLKIKNFDRSHFLRNPYLILSPWLQKLDEMRLGHDVAIKRVISYEKLKWSQLSTRHKQSSPTHYYQILRRQLDNISRQLDQAIRQTCDQGSNKIASFLKIMTKEHKTYWKQKRLLLDQKVSYKKLDDLFVRYQEKLNHRFSLVKEGLNALNPKNVLSKGYGIVFSEKDNSVILDATKLVEEEGVEVLLARGRFKATVTKVISS